jgi:hypothetical protein
MVSPANLKVKVFDPGSLPSTHPGVRNRFPCAQKAKLKAKTKSQQTKPNKQKLVHKQGFKTAGCLTNIVVAIDCTSRDVSLRRPFRSSHTF